MEYAHQRIPYPHLARVVSATPAMSPPVVVSAMFTPLALTGMPITSVLVFDLDHLKRAGVDYHLDATSLPVRAPYLIAAVVDLDAPHRPSDFFGKPHHCVSWLPVGRRHDTGVVGKRSPGRKSRVPVAM